jgi:sirohydrochlorin cobaltochelatase
MTATKCVILVGHGGIPRDCPRELIGEFKRLEAAAHGKPSKELAAVDAKLRAWPRTAETDPYKTGLEAVAKSLRRQLPDYAVIEAYNEFCAPSLEEAFEKAVKDGATQITAISTMFTRGGVHSETEIPAIIAKLARAHPQVIARNVWPFDLDAVARFMAGEVARAESVPVKA